MNEQEKLFIDMITRTVSYHIRSHLDVKEISSDTLEGLSINFLGLLAINYRSCDPKPAIPKKVAEFIERIPIYFPEEANRQNGKLFEPDMDIQSRIVLQAYRNGFDVSEVEKMEPSAREAYDFFQYTVKSFLYNVYNIPNIKDPESDLYGKTSEMQYDLVRLFNDFEEEEPEITDLDSQAYRSFLDDHEKYVLSEDFLARVSLAKIFKNSKDQNLSMEF